MCCEPDLKAWEQESTVAPHWICRLPHGHKGDHEYEHVLGWVKRMDARRN